MAGKLDEKAFVASLKHYGEKKSVSPVDFKPGIYLELAEYRCPCFDLPDHKLTLLLYGSIEEKDVAVVNVALWILVNHKVKRLTYTMTDGGKRKRIHTDNPPVSLREALGKNLTIWKETKASEWTSNSDCFVRPNLVKPHLQPVREFEMLTLALSLFLAGYGLRGTGLHNDIYLSSTIR